ncbi:ribonuclease R family protein [Calothrix sp. NIES-3974]|uniref:ribonuclease R family protein n=1 Tax=Calothrix sp. NIES-3974 TaxID=2005462 RepID=UPI000B5DDC1D|nr:ribonuclease R family protein [Calothrix sp. NIES-3974]BAZ06495.1 3'-5' exoribonuclease, VacB and RNase II [Calothrix sp. NIES-3974]
MEFSIATLLANFTDDKLVARKLLEKKLGCEDEESLQKLHIALEVLEKIGLLVKERGKYRRVPEEELIEAKLRCSSKGFCFAIQDTEGAEDIYIRESHLSNAWNGDRVLVKVLKEGSRRRSPEGEVKLILERSNHTLLARIKQVETGFRAVPLDDRLLFELKIQDPDVEVLSEAIDHLAHVEVLRYPLAQYPPVGRVVQILGSDAEAAADIDLVTCKHDLSRTFTENVLDAASKLQKKILKADLKNRIDLRSQFMVSIAMADDGVLENALSLETLSDGNVRIGFHISDVAHYVPPEEALDREALKRGRSVYLGDLILPMFPEAVTERCGLLAGYDRLALSFLIDIDPQTGEVVSWEATPSVVKVDKQLTHAQANAIFNGTARKTKDTGEILEILSTLHQISGVLQAKRFKRGSLQLNLPPAKNPYNDEGSLGCVPKTDSPVQMMMTELVLLVNQLMAEHLSILDVPTIWRVQGAPDGEDVQEMLKLAMNLGVELVLPEDIDIQPLDYQHLTRLFAESASEQVLTYLLQDTLKPAVYSTHKGPHFGLALSEGYIHFTSPLRRYPDLLMQRMYYALLEHGRDRRNTRVKERINLRSSSCHTEEINWNVLAPELHQELQSDLVRVITQLNDREKEVQEAEADLAGLQRAALMKQRIGEVFNGVITGVQSYGFFVEIEVTPEEGQNSNSGKEDGDPSNTKPLRVEGLVHVSSLKDDWYEYRARQQALFGRKNRASYRLGDRVAVQVKSVDYYRQQIDLVTVSSDGTPIIDKDYNLHEEVDMYDDDDDLDDEGFDDDYEDE